MQTSALVRLRPQGNASPSFRAFRSLLRIARLVRRLPGFRRWQTFRALDASNALYFVIDWDTAASLRAAVMEPDVCRLWAMAGRWGFTMDPVEILPETFDRELSHVSAAATLLRVCEGARNPLDAEERDSEHSLRAIAAPGSIRIRGARSNEGTTGLSRIDFDSEDGIWSFQESPVCRAWARETRAAKERETWAINLPRLDWTRSSARRRAWCPARITRALNVRISSGRDAGVVQLHLQGHLDAHNSGHCERLCHTAIREGCHRLELDLSEVESISREALSLLTRTARSVKERGGQFVVTDRADRVRQVTRARHLQASVA